LSILPSCLSRYIASIRSSRFALELRDSFLVELLLVVVAIPRMAHLTMGRRKLVRKEWLDRWLESNKVV
jgi:hypothetical protein